MSRRIMKYLETVATGGGAGILATVPMTGFMLGLHRLLPKIQQYRVPPQRITDKLAKRVGIRRKMDKDQRRGLAWASHFSYGAGLGALFAVALVHTRRRAEIDVGGGLIYGLLVYLGSYAGWLPTVGVLPPPQGSPKPRVMVMIGAHLVYGVALGLLTFLGLGVREKLTTPTGG